MTDNRRKNVCILKCLKNLHEPLTLPHLSTVIVGRSKELQISDKECSRTQLELTADCKRKFVTVKRRGINPSQIDSIDIEQNKSSRLKQGQTLTIINMKYPHECVFFDDKIPEKRSHEGGEAPIRNKQLKSEEAEKVLVEHNLETIYVQNDTKNEDSISQLKEDKKKSTKQQFKGHWSSGLKSAKQDAENIVFKDDNVVAIKDKYPKAEYHWLVMPVDETVTNPMKLTADHIDLIEHMLEVGKKLTEKHQSNNKFRYGFHAIPSMASFHMHVVSQDFNSVCLKTKKHWNSFTTKYFVDAVDYINELKENGCITNRKHLQSLLSNPLKCHSCDATQKNMPTLKNHIKNCEV